MRKKAGPNQDSILHIREEKDQQRREKEQGEKLKIWEKGIKHRRAGALRKIEEIGSDLDEDSPKKATVAEAAHAALVIDRVHTKENMVKVIEKKREMFLLQMNIDIKKEEIRKLEEYSHVREEGLKISEDMLEEDLKEFNKFWTKCKEQTHQAMKMAEDETKRKVKHTQKVGKLNDKKQGVFNATQKNEELLNEYMKYKRFLDKLTPKEYLEDQRRKYEQKMIRKGRTEPTQVTQSYSDADLLYDSDSGKVDVYFKQPRQLMEIFGDLVEENLFLIENIQEQEQTLEESKHTLSKFEQDTNSKLANLMEKKDRMEKSIEEKQHRCELLNERLEKSKTTEESANPDLKELEDEIRKVYNSSSNPEEPLNGSLSMLTNIEQSIDLHLALFKSISKCGGSENYISDEGKKREKQRREDAHVKAREAESEKAKDKSKKYMERSQKPATK